MEHVCCVRSQRAYGFLMDTPLILVLETGDPAEASSRPGSPADELSVRGRTMSSRWIFFPFTGWMASSCPKQVSRWAPPHTRR